MPSLRALSLPVQLLAAALLVACLLCGGADATALRTIGGVQYTFDQCAGVTFGELCWQFVGPSVTIAYSYAWTGYIAVGFSSNGQMIGSTAVIGWAGGSPYIDNFDLKSYSGNSPGATTLQISNASVTTNSSGFLTLLFTRPANLTATSYAFANLSPSGSNTILQSHGTLPSSPNSVQQHSMPPGVNTVSFAAAGAPSTSASSSSTASSSLSSSGAGAGSVRVIAGVVYRFDFCESLQFGELCWLTVGDTITLAYSYSWSGWIGIGFSSNGKMIGSSAVIGWMGSQPYIDDYYLRSQSDGGNSPDTALALINKTVSTDASTGITTLLFSRPLNLPSASYATINPQSSNTLIEAHGSLPSGPSSVAWHGSGNHAQSSVSFASGSVVAVESDLNKWKDAHAALMTLSFGFLFPVGVLCARFLKGYGPIWFHLHRGFVLSALALLIAGFAIAINKIGTGYYTTHRGFGIYVFSAMLFQPLNAIIRPHPPAKGEQPTLLRQAWEQLHRWNARIAYVFAIVNIGIGFHILQPAQRYMIVFWVLWSCVMAVGVLLQMWVLWTGQAVGGAAAADTSAVAGKSAAETPTVRVEAA